MLSQQNQRASKHAGSVDELQGKRFKILVVGDPGVGKTRFVNMFCRKNKEQASFNNYITIQTRQVKVNTDGTTPLVDPKRRTAMFGGETSSEKPQNSTAGREIAETNEEKAENDGGMPASDEKSEAPTVVGDHECSIKLHLFDPGVPDGLTAQSIVTHRQKKD